MEMDIQKVAGTLMATGKTGFLGCTLLGSDGSNQAGSTLEITEAALFSASLTASDTSNPPCCTKTFASLVRPVGVHVVHTNLQVFI